MTRKERGRGLLSNEDSAQVEIEILRNFVASSKEKEMEAVAQEKALKRSEDFNKDMDAV